jgi:hypothetical protein
MFPGNANLPIGGNTSANREIGVPGILKGERADGSAGRGV